MAKLRTLAIASPVLAGEGRVAHVEGWVVDVIGRGASGPRFVVAPRRVSGLAPEQTPARLRITLREGEVLGPGAAVRFTALLNPPPAPVSPGAYDFARDAFFRRIGGSGIALKPLELTRLAPPSEGLRLAMAVNAARWSLSRRIVASLGERRGGIAAAMVTGHEAWLDPADAQALRDAGLAHILSISGLHMAVVGGFVFALFRFLVSLWPWLALRVSGKKIAAVAALAAVLAYLVISGRPPPAERAAVTAGTAFLAILLDRRALSLHALAVAALVVLTLQPEAVAQPGFQMSFSATAALLALAESWPREGVPKTLPWQLRWIQRARGWLLAAVAASLVAGLATEPFGLQHFNRITLYGLPANLLTEPISSVMMPALAVGAVATVFGVGDAPLAVAGWGTEALTWVARTFAAAPHAVVQVASAPDWALPVSFLGVLALCLWRGWLRWVCLPLAAAVALTPRPETPVAWIAADGAAVAVRSGEAALALRPKAQAFATERWALRRGLKFTKPSEDPPPAPGYDCNRDHCLPVAGAALPVAAWWRRKPPSPEALEALCATPAQLIVLRTGEGADPACRGKLVLGEADLKRGGSAEVYARPNGWRVVWSAPIRGQRPWTPAAPDALSDTGG